MEPESWQISFWVDADLREGIMAALEEMDPFAVASFEDGASWRIEAWFADEDTALQAARPFTDASVRPVLPQNWVAASLRELNPVATGRFFVYAPHWTEPLPPGLIPLEIAAGTAFGTGHHGTTAGCLEALSLLKKFTSPRAALDLGCGTGVLGIAARKLWPAARVSLSDIDPDATAFAREAAKINKVTGLEIITAPGLDHRALRQAAPFDLIIANILARPLCGLAPSIAGALAPGGHVVLSGLMHHQEMRVLSRYRPFGLSLHTRLRRGDWSTLILH